MLNKFLGWIALFFLVSSYLFLLIDIKLFLTFNALASFLFVIYALFNHDYPVALANLFIFIVLLIKIYMGG